MKTRLNNREIGLLVAGLLVGLLVGMILVGSSDDLRTSLFGTASDETEESASDSAASNVYYLVDLPTAQEWLVEHYPDSEDKITETASMIGKLPAEAFDFNSEFAKAQDDGTVDELLPRMYAALADLEDTEDLGDLKVDEDNGMSVCLGLDDDPYDEPTMYFYLTLPSEVAKDIEIPDSAEWKQLEKPRDNDLFWMLLACYPEGA
jgi:hypothetical protein